MQILDEKLEKYWKRYLLQSAGAGVSISLLLLALIRGVDLVIVAAAGSTAFVVFGLPKQQTAESRNVVGGHILCAVVGIACSYLPSLYLQGGVAVGLGTLLMVSTKTEHPPAAGTALGLAMDPVLKSALFVSATAIVFSIIRLALLPWLKDLM